MSTENPGSPAPQGGASPPTGSPGADASAPAPTPAPDGPKFAQLEEVVGLRKEVRKLTDLVASLNKPADQAPTPKPKKAEPDGAVDVSAIEAKWERKLALKDAIADLGIGAHRKAIERLYAAENPDDPASWLAQTAAEFGWAKPAPAPATPATPTPPPTPKPTPAPGTSNLGPPGAESKLPLPDNIMQADLGALRGMSKADRKAYFERSVGGGIGEHPAHRKR